MEWIHALYCNDVLCSVVSPTGGDRRLFGEASYQLGSAFINNGDPQTALTVATLASI